ncbi:Fibroblast growth factor receptor 3 [Holothuria leucospilota]|uniref:receptor protein-tyrosine kinase n=1 Tax=Holothuria leucospilota TaxID=206669 RepID=A0A9Q1BXQ8_HOLLE|nr:Fibroblast growth factor receptor 3 [Holothuria leucospilota]
MGRPFLAFLCGILTFSNEIKGSLGLISLIKIVNIGESVKLQCENRDRTSGTFVWWVNGQIGFSGSTRLEKSFDNLGIVSLSETASVLQIFSFKPNNEGNYTCALGRTAEMTFFVTSQDKTVAKTVSTGERTSFQCNIGRKHSGKIAWLVNGKVTFTSSHTRLDNARMTYENGTSVLKFDNILQMNEGNYTCLVENIPVITVLVKIKVPYILFEDVERTNDVTRLQIMCMNSECPTNLSLKSGSIYVFQCYSYISIEEPHVFQWKVNDRPTNHHVMPSIILEHDSSAVRYTEGSQLVLHCQPDFKRISCSVNNASVMISIDVDGDSLWNKVLPVPFIVIPGAVILLALVACITFIAFLAFKKKRHFEVNSRENEGCFIPVFLRQQISFNVEIPSSSYILRFAGTLSTKTLDDSKVLISCPRDTMDPMNRRLWNSYSQIILQLPEHSNVLRAIGICEDIETSYILQDYSCTVTLKSHLDPECVLPSAESSSIMYGAKLRIAYDIINGMEFIVSRGCCHPGLSTNTILVNSVQLCKLYDFCSREDGSNCLKFYLKRNDDTFKRLAPECLLRGEYSTASDVWAIAVVIWEVFSSGNDPFRGVNRVDFERLLQRNVMLEQPKDCPEEVYDVMKLCWAYKSSDRLQMTEMKRKLESLSNTRPKARPSNSCDTKDRKSNQERKSNQTEAPVYQFPVRPNSNRSFLSISS